MKGEDHRYRILAQDDRKKKTKLWRQMMMMIE